jgi:hypothetical protein
VSILKLKKTHIVLGPLQRANLNDLMETGPVSETLYFLCFTLQADGQKSVNCVYGARGSIVVKALCYKSEGRGYENR